MYVIAIKELFLLSTGNFLDGLRFSREAFPIFLGGLLNMYTEKPIKMIEFYLFVTNARNQRRSLISQ